MRKGKIVGDGDKLVIWYKPNKCPQGLSLDEFDALPPSITVREIYYYIVIPGFRCQRVSLITTLLDKTIYPTLEIVGLYDKRWDVELDLRHLKTTLGMDVLRCKTPSMIRKEIHVYLLAYNLLRSLMWQAGNTYNTPPLRLSLQGTRHHLLNFVLIVQIVKTLRDSHLQNKSCNKAFKSAYSKYINLTSNYFLCT